MTLQELEAAYPELFSQVRAEARAEGYREGVDDGRKEGMDAGAKAERERIRGVEDQALAGHDTLIAEMKYDGKTTGPEAAVKILQAEKAVRSVKLEAFRADGVVLAAPEPIEKRAEVKPASNLPLKDRALLAWDKDPDMREEYAGDFDAYVAYLEAEQKGLVKIYKGKGGND